MSIHMSIQVRSIFLTVQSVSQALVVHHAALYFMVHESFYAEFFHLVHNLRHKLAQRRSQLFSQDSEVCVRVCVEND